MTQKPIISWHPQAILTDQQGNRIAACTKAMQTCDPTDPIAALPAYIAAIATGDLPVMGAFDGHRPKNSVGDFLTQTGGSTGAPKTILRSSESWIRSFDHMAQHFGIGHGANVAALGHLNHSLALYAGLEALHQGANFHALGGLPPHHFATELSDRAITHLYATPTQLRLMPMATLPSVKAVLVGGGMMDATNMRHTQTLFPNAQITEFYGAAETSFITLTDATTPQGSVGRAFPDVHISIRNGAGASCQTGEIGQVWVQTPLAFKSYLPETPQNQTALHVGEMGYLDQKGYLFLAGRSDRAVTIADQTVYLDQLETILAQTHKLQNIALFARPDALRGYTLHAVIQSDAITLSELATELPRHIQPRSLIQVTDWPLLPSGKTDYKALEQIVKGTQNG